jgi:hypothetical protein
MQAQARAASTRGKGVTEILELRSDHTRGGQSAAGRSQSVVDRPGRTRATVPKTDDCNVDVVEEFV